jgi:hypothetical protein
MRLLELHAEARQVERRQQLTREYSVAVFMEQCPCVVWFVTCDVCFFLLQTGQDHENKMQAVLHRQREVTLTL